LFPGSSDYEINFDKRTRFEENVSSVCPWKKITTSIELLIKKQKSVWTLQITMGVQRANVDESNIEAPVMRVQDHLPLYCILLQHW